MGVDNEAKEMHFSSIHATNDSNAIPVTIFFLLSVTGHRLIGIAFIYTFTQQLTEQNRRKIKQVSMDFSRTQKSCYRSLGLFTKMLA